MDKMNIIIISTADWDNPFWTNKQHVAKTLSELGHKVVYFESLGLRAPSKNSHRDLSRMLKRLTRFFRRPRKISENLTVFSPLVIPKHEKKIVSYLNNMLMSLYLKYFEFNYFSGPVIYWTYNPLSLAFLRSRPIVYHCVDDLTAAPGLPVERIQKEEMSLIKESFITFVTSKTLKDKFDKLGFEKKVHYFSNVVDQKHFSQKVGVDSRPEDLKNIKGPILGFVGAISSYKVDFELIRKLALEKKDFAIVLIGQIGEGAPETSVERLRGIPNIHFLGPKNYDELPRYLSFFDVALLPCVVNDYTRSMFPMKFFEYLCARKKIVTTNLDSLEEFKDCFYMATSNDDFVYGIEKALKMSFEEFCNVGRADELVMNNTWSVRTKKMLDLIEGLK